jgi:hypothetical protein
MPANPSPNIWLAAAVAAATSIGSGRLAVSAALGAWSPWIARKVFG